MASPAPREVNPDLIAMSGLFTIPAREFVQEHVRDIVHTFPDMFTREEMPGFRASTRENVPTEWIDYFWVGLKRDAEVMEKIRPPTGAPLQGCLQDQLTVLLPHDGCLIWSRIINHVTFRKNCEAAGTWPQREISQ